MLAIQQLTKYISGRPLIEGGSFRLEDGEKAALVGVNGSGKSTLLRMCAGLISPDGGQISMPKDATVGYLPQHADLESDRPVFDELKTVFDEVMSHFDECEELAHKMGELDHESPEYEQVTERYGRLQHEIDRLGAYEVDSKIEKIMAGLGFPPGERDKPCSAYSGGWQMRILLGKLLLHNPDVLLLDEPTNHLDLETMIWLENWIRVSDSTVLLVSHERNFMDALATRVFEVHEGTLAVYRGNYTDYLRQRDERWAQWQREYDNQQDEINHLQKFIDRFRYNASKAAIVQSRVKALEKIERIAPPPKPQASIRFRFPAPDRGNKEVFTLEGVGKRYGDLQVLAGVDLPVWRNEKIALVGLNGAGKSTLLKMMAGVEKPTAGEIKSGPRIKAEYFAQYDADGMTLENTVLMEIGSVAPAGMMEQARALLGGFFFTGDDVDKPISVLSGGERTRLRLAKMLFSGANVLLLDEPTNHLDIASRATLMGAMKDYEGAIVFVSHDRSFLDAVATRVIEVKDGKIRSFPGNYADYCHALKVLGETSPLMGASVSASKPSVATHASSSATSAGPAPAKNGKEAAPAPDKKAALEAQRKALKENAREHSRVKKLVGQLEKEIETVETRLAEIELELAKPEVYKDFRKSTPLTEEQKKLKERHAATMQQWEKNAALLE